MTDSMKFGPEWLRNMSADTTNPSLTGNTSGANSSSSSTSNNAIGSSCVGGAHNNSNSESSAVLHTPSARNMLSEFRYGREEMLSLFDRNCNTPDILPSYKKLYMDKAQYPLAMTPSTDEEMIAQSPVLATQRPTWIQRSPVGFGSPSRGAGRGGSVDRGRMRGKTVYHPLYQRPTAMFDEDLRLASTKSDRSWSERNGANDALGGSATSGLSSEWNGTPSSSPRKEFSSHSRNMENWRRNRNEDGSAPTGGGSIANSDGWRGGSSVNSFGNTHRWGRSTSWRDEDLSAGSGEVSGYIAGSSIIMQRSYSTISTSGTERNSSTYGSNNSKISGHTSNFPSGNVGRVPNSITTRSSQWQGANNGPGSGGGIGSGLNDGEDNLPEWAMENSADGGGTFDSSGAFHGSADEYETSTSPGDSSGKEHYKSDRKKSSDSSDSAPMNEGKDDSPIKTEMKSSNVTTAVTGNIPDEKDTIVSEGGTNTSNTDIKIKSKNTENINVTETSNEYASSVVSTTPAVEVPRQAHINYISNTGNSPKKGAPSYDATHNSKNSNNNNIKNNNNQDNKNNNTNNNNNNKNNKNSNNNSDFSDHMKEVADIMVEKLIMDDDTSGSNAIINSETKSNPVGTVSTAVSMSTGSMLVDGAFVSPVVAAMLKQTVNAPHHPAGGPAAIVAPQNTVPISPTTTLSKTMAGSSSANVGPAHKGPISLYGGGVVVDHVTMQQHHLQQQQLSTAAGACLPQALSNGDLWYYRDPQSKVQGPFTAIEMTEWYRAGYFDENLLVRRVVDTRYRALGELIKLCNGSMPFTHSHLIPIGLENMHMPNVPPMGILLNDFNLNKVPLHEQREELKGNVTAAANSVSAAIKSMMNPVDMSHMLHMHFQMLQQEFYRHQERAILNELSKNDRFQRLSPSEKEAIIREKVHMLVVPEYLTSFNALSSALATLNPTAANQLYDAIDECAKKDHIFTGTTGNSMPQPQQSTLNSFLEADNLIMNPQQLRQQQQQLHTPFSSGGGAYGARVLGADNNSAVGANEFNLGIFLQGNSEAEHMQQQQQQHQQQQQQQQQQKAQDFMGSTITNPSEFLTEQQLLAATATQSPIMQMWLPQLGASTNPPQQQQQQQQHQHQQPQPPQMPQQPQPSGQWGAGGPLVGIPSAVMAGSGNLVRSQGKSGTAALMWDDVSILQHQQQQQKAQNEQQLRLDASIGNFDEQQKLQALLQQGGSSTTSSILSESLKHTQQQQQQLRKETSHNLPELQTESPSMNSQQKFEELSPQSSSTVHKHRKDESTEKPQNAIKRNNNSKQAPKVKDETSSSATGNNNNNNKKSEEDRRRELAEEKRRQKEEKKRQQMEEEKRRLQQVEDEKRRQMQEEKERQQQIQAQRRKALLGNNNNQNSVNSGSASQSSTIISTTSASTSNKTGKIQSSVAPWSTQSNIKSGPPCLAEIQKAERRERRADQQRQMEMLEKQMRASAIESNDSILKWNASPVPVKNFAEIQAEEAKQLAAEQLEMQRRKEYETPAIAATTLANANFASGSVNNIWGSTRFWEAPSKFSGLLNSNSNPTSAAVVSAGILTNSNKQQTAAPQKSTPLSASNQQALSGSAAATLRNLRKSQTVSIMQNTTTGAVSATSASNKGSKNNVQQSATGNNKQKLQLNSKNQNNSMAGSNSSTNKKDDLENEFTGWCTKSLNNMNTKVDVPTFVTFLQDLESPYEVKDYIRMYLGESKEYTEFAKQFLERRSKYKNLQRAQNAHNDDMCKPAPAITPSGNDNSDNKGKQKKIKKNKMTKLDARILGFSVTAAEGRINVGSRDYADGP